MIYQEASPIMGGGGVLWGSSDPKLLYPSNPFFTPQILNPNFLPLKSQICVPLKSQVFNSILPKLLSIMSNYYHFMAFYSASVVHSKQQDFVYWCCLQGNRQKYFAIFEHLWLSHEQHATMVGLVVLHSEKNLASFSQLDMLHLLHLLIIIIH